MDGENKGKPYEKMDDLGETPLFLETPTCRKSTIFLIFGNCLITIKINQM